MTPTPMHRRTNSLAATVATLALVACGAPAGGSPGPAAAIASGRIEVVEVPAPALEGNLVGTAAVQQAAVYLPPGYDNEAARRYPALYLLHGIFDTHRTWLDFFGVAAILDRLIQAGAIAPIIVVMPDGGNAFGGGFYRNSPVSGGWADFVADDLVGFIDERYRTVAGLGSRAVIGHSMGGYGALHLGMTRADVFSVVWGLSPCCLAAVEDFGFGNDAWKTAFAFDRPEEVMASLQRGEFYPAAAIGWLSAFNPDVDDPPMYVDFPFDVVDGEVVLDDDADSAYRSRMAVDSAVDHVDALRSLRGLAFDVGLADEFVHIPAGTIELSGELARLRVPHLFDVYDGDHRQQVAGRLESLVLRWVVTKLDVPAR